MSPTKKEVKNTERKLGEGASKVNVLNSALMKVWAGQKKNRDPLRGGEKKRNAERGRWGGCGGFPCLARRVEWANASGGQGTGATKATARTSGRVFGAT